jgi:hypothetical protein
MAAGAVARLTKRGILVKSILVGAEHRRRPKTSEPWIVVAQVANTPVLSEFESETFAIHGSDSIPKLHRPSVFPEECLATYDFACKAGFKNSAHLLITVPIPVLAKLTQKNFEKLGVPPSIGFELQARLARYKLMCKGGFRECAHLLICVAMDKLAQCDFEKLGIPEPVGIEIRLMLQAEPTIKKIVRPIGTLDAPQLPTTVQYHTTRELLCSNEFVEFAHCLQTVPIDRLVHLEGRDFKELNVPYLYGRCIQQILQRAEEPKAFTLF